MRIMSRKSSVSSKKRRTEHVPLDRPIAPAILAAARDVARCYGVVVRPHDRLGFLGVGLEIPTVFSNGGSPAECTEATYEALTVAVATMLESGVRPPEPSAARRRTEQMNVRLSAEEKLQLREAGLGGVQFGLPDVGLAE
jgi:predicted RNase H-like HicB family nuclease